jgi:hypothetical protein
MAITPLPSAPLISDDPATFNTKAFAWVGALDTFTTEANALGNQVDADAAQVASDADESAASSAAAVAAANYKGEWSTLTGALAIPASVSHNGAVWVLTVSLADVTADEPGAGSPSAWLIVTLPGQSGNSGKFLTTDGNQTSWGEVLDDVEVGTLQYFASSTLPDYPSDKWLQCNGSTVSQATYPELFSVLGLQPSIATAAVTWTTRTSQFVSGRISSAAFGNDLFLLAGDSGKISTSTNAITWTSRTSGIITNINALTYHNTTYVFAGLDGALRTSTNGTTWTSRTSGTTLTINALHSNGTTVVYGADTGLVGTSTNGTSWSTVASGLAPNIRSVIFGNNLWVFGYATGSSLRTSTDLITFSTRSLGATTGCYGLAYGNGLFVAALQNGGASTSTNGTSWTYQGVISGATELTGVVYDRGLFIAVGVDGQIFTTTNAAEWVNRSTGTETYNAVSVGNNLFFAAGNTGTLRTAPSSSYNESTQFALPVKQSGTSILSQYDDGLYIKAT